MVVVLCGIATLAKIINLVNGGVDFFVGHCAGSEGEGKDCD
jgi:hypothetical protein